jgi:YafQ family addiction module toxin component
MYSYELRKNVEKDFFNLAKKNPAFFLAIEKKIGEITRNPHHYKNLRRPLQHLKRVHVRKSFVLVFSIDEKKKAIIFERFAHHDKIYK